MVQAAGGAGSPAPPRPRRVLGPQGNQADFTPSNLEELARAAVQTTERKGPFTKVAEDFGRMPKEIMGALNMLGQETQRRSQPGGLALDPMAMGQVGWEATKAMGEQARHDITNPTEFARENPADLMLSLLPVAGRGIGALSKLDNIPSHVDDFTANPINPAEVRGAGQIQWRYPDDPNDFWLHYSPTDTAQSIQAKGLDPAFRGRHGDFNRGIHFAAQDTYRPMGDVPMNLYRFRRDAVPDAQMQSSDDFFVNRNIPPSAMEAYMGEGRWERLADEVGDDLTYPPGLRGVLQRFIKEETGGGTFGRPDADARDLWNAALSKYRKNRQPEATADFAQSLSPEGKAIRAVLEETSLMGPRKAPTLDADEAAALERALQEPNSLRRLMEESDFTGRPTQGAQAGADRMGNIRGYARNVGGEGSIDPYDDLSTRPMTTPRELPFENNVDDILDQRDIWETLEPRPHSRTYRDVEGTIFRNRIPGGEDFPPGYIPPPDQPSTLEALTEALAREGTPEGYGRFVPRYNPETGLEEFMDRIMALITKGPLPG